MNMQATVEVARIESLSGKETRINIVSGIRLRIIRSGLSMSVLWVAFRMCHNPVRAFRLLRALMKERMNIQDNSGKNKAVRCGSKYYWSTNIPGWPSEKFNYFIRNEIQRVLSPQDSTLQTVIFAITNICLLNCVHCYESENLSFRNKLDMEQLKLVIDKIRDTGIRHVHLSGGEPLNRFEDMLRLMDYAGSSFDFWINTSGYGLTKEKAFMMKKKGMTGALISLDDWDENRHNSFRKNHNSFYWVKEAIGNCNAAGIIVCLSVCPVKEFVSEENLDRYYHKAKELGASFIRILEPRKAGRFANRDVLLDARQIDIIDRFMIARNSDPAFMNYPIIQFPGRHQRKSGCLGAGNRYLYIDSNGEIHACPFCQKTMGNITVESLSTGINRAKASGCLAFSQSTVN